MRFELRLPRGFGRVLFSPIALLLFAIACLLPLMVTPTLRATIVPDAVQPELGKAYIVTVPSRVYRLFTAASDESGAASQSRLVLYEDGHPLGPSHSSHAAIRQSGGGAFSHWDGHLYFSSSDGSDPRTNGRSYVVVTATRLPWLIEGGLVLASIACFAAFGRNLQRRHGTVIAGKLALWNRAAAACFVALDRNLRPLAAALIAIYLLTIAIGLYLGDAIPVATIFRFLSSNHGVNAAVVFLPHGMMVAAAIGAAVFWAATIGRAQLTDPGIGWLGLPLIGALLVFLLGSGSWSGFITPADVHYMSLAGLVPNSDASAYFLGPFEVGYTGRWGEISSYRPPAAAFRSVVTALGGLSYTSTLIVQALLLAVPIYLATAAIARWIGVWSALAFLAFALVMARPFLATAMTEPLALFWAFLAVAFLADAVRTDSFGSAVFALLFMAFAQVTRSGAVFIVPALMIWIVANFLSNRQVLIRNVVIVTIVAGLPTILSFVIHSLYGTSRIVPSGWNISYFLCGIARGTDWAECQAAFFDPSKPLPSFDEQSRILYEAARHAFLSDPGIAIKGLLSNATGFLTTTPRAMLEGYTRWFSLPDTITHLCLAAILPGLIFHFVCRARRSEIFFWGLAFAAITVSASVTFVHDGWRTLYATHPLIAMFLAIGFSSRASNCFLPPMNWKIAAGVTTAIAVAFIAVPALLHARLKHDVPPWKDGSVMAGAGIMTGFVVVADDAPRPHGVSSLTASEFSKMVGQTALVSHWGPFVQPLVASVPFSMVWTVRVGWAAQRAFVYVGPADLVMRRDVKMWRFYLREPEWKKKDTPVRLVERAEPIE